MPRKLICKQCRGNRECTHWMECWVNMGSGYKPLIGSATCGACAAMSQMVNEICKGENGEQPMGMNKVCKLEDLDENKKRIVTNENVAGIYL